MKAVKIVALVLGGLIVLAIIAVGIIAATFDPNDYKPQLVQTVKEKYGRTLAIDGKIGLTFFPRVGGSLERVTLSEPNSTQTFAKIGEARVSVELLPLLSRKVIVDRVSLSGVEANLVKRKDGSTNFDDLMGKKDKPAAKPPAKGPDAAPPVAVDVSGVSLKNTAISWRDEASGTAVRVSGMELDTGRIASGVPGKMSFSGRVQGENPKMDAAVKLSSGYRLDFDKPAVQLSGLDLQVTGDVAGNAGLKANISAGELGWAGAQRIEVAKLVVDASSKEGLEAKVSAPKLLMTPERSESSQIEANVRLAQGPRKTMAKLTAQPLKASGKKIEFPSVSVELDVKQPDLSVQGTLVSPIVLALDTSQASLPKIDGRLQLEGAALPVKTLAVALGGTLQANWEKKSAQADLAARFDESNAKLKLSLADYSRPAPRFELAVDRLNVDRYVGGEKPAASPAGKSGEEPQGKPAAEKPIDLSGLKGLDAAGSVRIGSLVASKVKAENVQVTMKAADGRLDLNPIAASLYQGTAAGAAAVNANNNQFSVRQQLTNVAVGPLLRDAADKDLLEGRGNVALDVTTAGNTPSALKRALNGKANINLRDGSIKGVDLGAIARRVRSIRSGETTAAGKTEKTDFTELTASFNIKNGVAHNEDLSMKSPFLRVGGAGDIDIGAGALDYTVKASVVATSTGQEGRALSDVRGLTFPVKLAGPFDNLKYSVDVGALATEAAKSEVTRRVEEKAKGRIGDALKGILGR
jgi:AsmA protein